MPKPAWKLYQEETAVFFRGLGMDATTDQVLEGARGKHAIDVVVRTRRAGLSQLWIVECKLWKRRVGKDRVQVLAEVVADVGADRGLLLSESSFQAGAVRVARHTNVTLTSLSDLRENTGEEKAELDARSALKHLLFLQERIRQLRDWGRSGPNSVRMLPGVDMNVILPVIGRVGIALSGLQEALAGLFPAVVDISHEDVPVKARSVWEAVSAAEVVIDWAERQVIPQERAAIRHRVDGDGGPGSHR
jgi:hypothetical protein